ncbi:MAG: TIGR00730 family Rossman fold protein [Planctomycetaceae bacterium]
MTMTKSICVFSGSRCGERPEYRAAAEALATAMAEQQLRLVYGGGNIGLMGVMADRLLAAAGKVVGVIPQCLLDKEVAHHGVTQLHVVETMHERKALMADLSDAFIAIPGGFGTLEELFEVLTWRQLQIHNKPCGLLNTAGYFDDLLRFLDRCVADGFLQEQYRRLILVSEDPRQLLERVRQAITAMPTAHTSESDVR